MTSSRHGGVLHIVLSLEPGGTERLVIELCRRLQSSRPQAICCLDQPGAWSDEAAALGIPVVALHRQPGFRPALALRLIAAARAAGATTLHCHQYSPFVYGALARAVHPALRVVFTEHGRLAAAPPSTKRRVVNQCLGRIPQQIVAVSEDLRRHMLAEGFAAKRVGVILNGIEPGQVPSSDDRADTRLALGLASSSFIIGTIARLDPVKNLTLLVDAFAKLHDTRPEATLVIVGDGRERAALMERAASQRVADRVRFIGHVDNARKIVSAFDVFVNSSVTEGISVTILEALAAAVPVVATAVGGTPEIIENDRSGLLVPSGDTDALANRLRDIWVNPALRARLARDGRGRVEERFTLERMALRYLECYGAASSSSESP